MRDRCDRADHSEGNVIGQGKAVVAGVIVGPEIFHARYAWNRVLELRDLVIKPADLGLVELEPSELLGLPNADAANAVDRLAAIVERSALKCFKGRLCSRDGAIHRGKDTQVPRGSGVSFAIGRGGPAADLGQDLLNHVADEIFGHLHGWHRCTLVMEYLNPTPGRLGHLARPNSENGRCSAVEELTPGVSTSGENHLALDVDGIHQSDYHRVDRQLFGFGRQAGARALADQNHFVDPRTEGVDCNKRPPGRHETVARLLVHPVGLDGQELVPQERWTFWVATTLPVTRARNIALLTLE